ncbi:hypothetical protein C6W92_10925 [Roseovarius sp. A46]|nr:hypothetical protein C6W92_10925 [Roseovarius sp. A46]
MFLLNGLPCATRACTSRAVLPAKGDSSDNRQETILTFRTRLASILGATALALATPLAAQQTPPPQIAAEDVTEAQVVAFVDAILAVEEVRKDYGPRIDAVEDEAQQQALAEEANTAAAAAVDGVENMDLDSYVAIANAAGESDTLNQRIIARITEVREQ